MLDATARTGQGDKVRQRRSPIPPNDVVHWKTPLLRRGGGTPIWRWKRWSTDLRDEKSEPIFISLMIISLQDAIFSVVAAILHLGFIEFTKGQEVDSSVPRDEKSKFHLQTAPELLMCDAAVLEDALCKRVMVTPEEVIKRSIDPVAATINRDGLAKTIYSRLFDWLVQSTVLKAVKQIGGESTADNCQILQTTVNRYKSDKEIDRSILRGYSCDLKFSDKELDIIEMAVYGDVIRPGNQCKCRSVAEMLGKFKAKDHMKACKLPNSDEIP